MTLILTLQQGPRAQAVRQMRLDDGELIVGRGADAGWQIEDPDMFISRAHLKVTARPDGYAVTDTSSSGLFVDDAPGPLGAGNTLRLQSGMRLRLGDYVLAVEIQQQRPPVELPQERSPPFASLTPAAPSRGAGGTGGGRIDDDGFFSAREDTPPPPPRPAGLPNPFEQPIQGGFQDFGRDAQHGRSEAFDDPFSMEPVRTSDRRGGEPKARGFFDDPFEAPVEGAPRFPSDAREPQPRDPFAASEGFGFGPGAEPSRPPQPSQQVSAPAPAKPQRAPWELPDPERDKPAATDWNSMESDWKSLPQDPASPSVSDEPVSEPGWKDLPPEMAVEQTPIELPAEPEPAPKIEVLPPEPVAQVFAKPLPQPDPPAPRAAPRAAKTADAVPPPAGDTAMRDAFLRGLGLRAEDLRGKDPAVEMEKFGREYRLMMEGLMQLLRKRAEEKSNARVAQTVVGASEVNPLKFLPTVDDAVSMIASDRSTGFLRGEAAIADAVRDLAQHHVRTWRGLQTALRRMIDRFDPASLEEELKTGSSLGSLLTGGRNAKLWELYQKRHREIATNAESRFLGDIGADFRDAYEEE